MFGFFDAARLRRLLFLSVLLLAMVLTLMLLLWPWTAWAQAAHQTFLPAANPPPAKVSVALFWAWFLPIAMAAVTGLGTWATGVMAAKLKLQKGSQLLDDFDQAMLHGVAFVEDALNSLAAHNGTITIPQIFANGAKIVMDLVPAAANELNVTPASIAALISSKLSAPATAAVVAHVAASGGQVKLPAPALAFA